MSKNWLGVLALTFVISAHGQLDVRDGLIMQYLLDETGGNWAHDSAGNRNLEYTWQAGVGGATWLQPGVSLNRAEQETFGNAFDHIGLPLYFAPALNEHFSISAWIKGEPLDGETVVTGGILSLSELEFAVYDRRIELVINELGAEGHRGGVGSGSWATGQVLSNTEWQHVCVTNDGQKTRFYHNSELVHEVSHYIKPNSLHESFVTLGLRIQEFGAGSNFHYFNGSLRDVRVYDRALQPAELQAVQAGAREADETFAGLWVGEVVLDEVKEAKTDAWGPAGAPFSQRILMWSDGLGRMEILQEAMVVKTRADEPEEVVLTDETRVSEFDGIVPRNGELVGNRFSATTMPFAGESVRLSETGNGDEVVAVLSLPRSHPRNPFRHKYHPDLGVGTTIERIITIDWDEGTEPSDGQVSGLYSESVTGLHKLPLETRGTVTFTRVSLSTLLNP